MKNERVIYSKEDLEILDREYESLKERRRRLTFKQIEANPVNCHKYLSQFTRSKSKAKNSIFKEI